MKCPSCGADNPAGRETCGHCGSHLSLTPSSQRKAILQRIRSSPEYSRAQSPERHARLPRHGALQKAFLFAFFAFFIGVSGFMAVAGLVMGGMFGVVGARAGGGLGLVSLIPLLMAVVPLGFVVLGIFLLVTQLKKMHSVENDLVQPLPAIVVDKRTHVSGGGNSSARTAYYVTCEDEDGSRTEYQVWDGQMYGRMSVNDAGILYVRGGYGLDFDRVAV